MKHDRYFPNVTAYATDYGGMNIVYHTRSGPILINRHDIYVGGSLRHYGEFSHLEWVLMEQLVPEGSVVCEVGANFGAHTVNFAKLVGSSGAVFAFEPQRLVFQALCGNMALNGLANVWCHHLAVGNKKGHITVPPIDYENAANIGGLSLTTGGPGERVELVRLDDFLEVNSLQLIKIDVEGMEQAVLEGAHDLIAKYRPALYVENDRIPKSESLIRHVQGLGYRLYWHLPPLVNPDNYFGEQMSIPILNVVSINMLCIPRETDMAIEGLQEILDPEDHPLKPKT